MVKSTKYFLDLQVINLSYFVGTPKWWNKNLKCLPIIYNNFVETRKYFQKYVYAQQSNLKVS